MNAVITLPECVFPLRFGDMYCIVINKSIFLSNQIKVFVTMPHFKWDFNLPFSAFGMPNATRYSVIVSIRYSLISLHLNTPLHRRHNGRDSVSNHQHHDCLLNPLFRRRSKKISKLSVTGLCAGNSPGTGEFPAQMASNAENISIWWRQLAVYFPMCFWRGRSVTGILYATKQVMDIVTLAVRIMVGIHLP